MSLRAHKSSTSTLYYAHPTLTLTQLRKPKDATTVGAVIVGSWTAARISLSPTLSISMLPRCASNRLNPTVRRLSEQCGNCSRGLNRYPRKNLQCWYGQQNKSNQVQVRDATAVPWMKTLARDKVIIHDLRAVSVVRIEVTMDHGDQIPHGHKPLPISVLSMFDHLFAVPAGLRDVIGSFGGDNLGRDAMRVFSSRNSHSVRCR